VTFELERQRDQVKLTMIHDQFEPGSDVLEKVSKGWPLILSSLKSYVECGKVLYAPWYEERPLATKNAAGAAR
jgi:Activator of Hsp90 ATPase homolog 1-like protein